MIQEFTSQLWRQVGCRQTSGGNSGQEEMIPESQYHEREALDTHTTRTKMVRFADSTEEHYPTEARLRQKLKDKEAKARAAAEGSD
eukprot:9408935-Pyramimonas_sp.AAC.1